MSVKFIEIKPDEIDVKSSFARAAEFHGRGPFLAIGLRMGLLALRELNSLGHDGLEAIVETGTAPPLSCLIDGVQVANGCTLGKGNIRVRDGHRPRARFIAQSGKQVTIELREEWAERFTHGDPKALAEEALKLEDEELFRWETR